MTATTASINDQRTCSDSTLLHNWCRQRDQQAFESLVERYAALVHNTCLRNWSGNSSKAEEACQAVFIIFSQKAAQIRNAAALPGWLHRTAVNTVKMQQRSEQRERQRRMEFIQEQPPARELDPAIRDDWAALRTQLDPAINSLSSKLRQALILHYFEGRSVNEIAARSKCSQSAIKKRLHEGRDRLRQYFKRTGYTASLAWLGTALQAEVTPTCSATIIASCYQASAPLHIPGALTIAQGVMKTMFITKIKAAAVAALFVCSSSAALMYAADAENDQSQEKNVTITITKPDKRTKPRQKPDEQDTDKPATGSGAPATNTKVTLSFVDTSLKDAADMISMMSGLKVRMGERVDTKATLTLSVKDQTAVSAIKTIASLTGNTVEFRDDGSYLIKKIKKKNNKNSNTKSEIDF